MFCALATLMRFLLTLLQRIYDGFLVFLVLCVIAFFLWRISDQMPDVLFRLSEMQKDVAELRRQGENPAISRQKNGFFRVVFRY